jgi:predicted nuclease of predicted toxin-antitoxin system
MRFLLDMNLPLAIAEWLRAEVTMWFTFAK